MSWEESPCAKLSLHRRALNERLEHDAHEPLPERWVDLIHHLNEKERAALITKPPTK